MRLQSFIAGFLAFGAACGGAPDGGVATTRTAAVTSLRVPRAELGLARDSAVVLDSANALIARHSTVGLVTVDELNRPRVRTVRAYRLANPATVRDRFTIFILTRAVRAGDQDDRGAQPAGEAHRRMAVQR